MSVSGLGGNRTGSRIDGIVQIVQRIAGVAAFVKAEFCSGILAQSGPVYSFLKDVTTRLHTLGEPLVAELEPKKARIPWDIRTLPADEAFQAMEWLAEYLDHGPTTSTEPQCHDPALAADLRFVARYTSIVANSIKQKSPSGAITPPKSLLDGLSILSSGPFVVRTSEEATSKPKPDILELPAPTLLAANGDKAAPTSVPSTRDSSPHDLRPLPGDIDHSAHPLRGRRLASRAWFEDPAHFVDLVGEGRQWIAPAPEEHETISGGEGSFGSWHYIDASPLGISGVNAIKLEHPLNAKEVRAIDIDVLKFVRLMLWDWTNGYRNKPERKAEKKSLAIVKRELAHRKWEIKMGKTSRDQTPEEAVAEDKKLALPKDIAPAEPEPVRYELAQPEDTASAEPEPVKESNAEQAVPNVDWTVPRPDLRSLRSASPVPELVLKQPHRDVIDMDTDGVSMTCNQDVCSYCDSMKDAKQATPAVHDAITSAWNAQADIPNSKIIRFVTAAQKWKQISAAARDNAAEAVEKNGIDSETGKHVDCQEPEREAKLEHQQEAGHTPDDTGSAADIVPLKTVDGATEEVPMPEPEREPTQVHRTQSDGHILEVKERDAHSNSTVDPTPGREVTEVELLKHQLTALRAELQQLKAANEQLSDDAPEEAAVQKSNRTDEEDGHPLQHLVGRRHALTDSSSLAVEQNSEAGSSAANTEWELYTEDSDQDPTMAKWLAPLDGVQVLITKEGGRELISISQPNHAYNWSLDHHHVRRTDRWRHRAVHPTQHELGCMAKECRVLGIEAHQSHEREPRRGPSTEERESAVAEAAESVHARSGGESRSPPLRSSRGRQRLERSPDVGSSANAYHFESGCSARDRLSFC